jgi:hypothetical protein
MTAASWAFGPEKKKLRQRKTFKVAAGFLVGAMLFGGGAFAAWLASSNGNAYVKLGTLTAPVIQTQTAAEVGGALFPGGTEALELKVNNTSGQALVLTQLAANGSVTYISGSCSVDVLLNPSSPITGLNIAVPTGITELVIPNAAKLPASAPSTCQGAVAAVPVIASFSTT